MYNRRVKFGLKIPNRLGKNVRKPQGGDFLTHTVESRAFHHHRRGSYLWTIVTSPELRISSAVLDINIANVVRQ